MMRNIRNPQPKALLRAMGECRLLDVNNLSGFGGFSAKKDVTMNYVGATANTGDASTYTFTSHALGTPLPGRDIIVTVWSSSGDVTPFEPSSVTVAGVSATKLHANSTLDSMNASCVSMWRVRDVTNSTGNIVVTHPSGQEGCGISVHNVYNAHQTVMFAQGGVRKATTYQTPLPLWSSWNLTGKTAVISALTLRTNNYTGTRTVNSSALTQRYSADVGSNGASYNYAWLGDYSGDRTEWADQEAYFSISNDCDHWVELSVSFVPDTTAWETIVSNHTVPTVVASANSGTSSCNKPTGTTTGDFMVAVVSSTSNAQNYPPTSSTQLGWVRMGQSNNTTVGLNTALYAKFADASEPASYEWTVDSGGSVDVSITTFRGVNSLRPFDYFCGFNAAAGSTQPWNNLKATASGTTHTCDGVTTKVSNALWVIGIATASTPTYTCAGFTEQYDYASGWSTALYYKTVTSPGATGTQAITSSFSRACNIFSFALNGG